MANLGLPVQDFTTFVRNMAAAMTSACSQTLDFATGTVLRAVVEANASVALWIQWLILQVLAITRAATSNGSDLDTWMADFGVTRLPAVAASGTVVLSRLTPGLAATIPVGTSVRTADGTGRFSVVADATNPAWAGSAYSLAATAASLSVPIVADVPGSAGNLPAGALTVLATAIPGVDAVNNPGSTNGGLDAESDTGLRVRFSSFIDSRSRATAIAVNYAVQSVRQGLRFVLTENQLPGGTPSLGSFVVTVDDGSGSPPASLLASVTAAVDAIRPLGSTFTVQPPTVLSANVSLTVTLAASATLADVAAPISSAVTTWIASMPVGATLPISRLVQLAFAASPSVVNVSSVLINGATADLVPAATGLVMSGTITIGAA